MSLKRGMKVQIHSYKHDRSLHRVWETATVLSFDEDTMITANKNTKVIEHNGRRWYTKEPAICFFYEEYWFNVIAMLKKDGIYYYCNLSSPYVYDNEAIKYIDYDLDVKVFPDGKMIVLDEAEYEQHSSRMCYPEDIKEIIDQQMIVLQEKIKNKQEPFNEEYIKIYAKQYQDILKKNKVKNK
ncbi:conserved hypothetical protein (DUF402) [Alteracholeplasma palmae J233]|uniref:DUF402 domain-containing protein n=1 Tax=Alteracholeplasma palmae (strain ATCC 49389 / J233) TaxID=1318466 RepID=U4KRA5_ALTPJ|nr:DUF402 domain-containing protein [Alteracholeplasma palmae]CCV63991.1 conserved hypothetical protein (DUF402) [Alteracholeplasma palmae J233]